MNAAVIGYRNHPARIANLLSGFPEIDRLYIYHPDQKKLLHSNVQALSPKIEPTSDLSQLFDLDAVFISSPNHTHVDYIKSLINKGPYIYCEKPPASTKDELQYLRTLEDSKKRKLYFNFNYRYSALGITAKDFIRSGQIGNPLHFNFVSTHGIAFRESFKDNWRFVSDDMLSGIYGNVAIHYLDLCMWLLGDFEHIQVEITTWSRNSRAADAVSIFMHFRNHCSVNIFVSYAAPFINQAQLIFDDGFLELNNGSLRLYSPRDTFDAVGRFTQPPSQAILQADSSREYYTYSLRNSLKHFTSVVLNKGSFSLEDYDQSLKSNAIVFEY